MKKYLFTLVLIITSSIGRAQSISVEQSTNGIQIGLLGAWIYNESKLTNQLALRTEFGVVNGFWGGSFYEKNGHIMFSKITVEPRLYYNLNKRIEKSKRIDGNSGNFISLKTNYYPKWVISTNYDHISIAENLNLIPTWGIRRSISNHLNFEFSFGIGYEYITEKNYTSSRSDITADLNLRIGYTF